MSIPEYNTELINNIVSNLANIVPKNDSSIATYDYIYDSMDHQINSSGGSQHLETILQQLFSKMSDNQTTYNIPSKSLSALSSASSSSSLSSLSFVSSLPSLSNDNNKNSFHLLSIISFWIVLIVNPIVILFGVIGNLLTTYILIQFNIIKLPVSFYTIMLNLADTFNLLIPVLIFWLDNCFNRTPERGYFRDKSNFLCKALMCPDQLFAALSAWYMCAISFNRWYSVCRPSSYYACRSNVRTSTSASNNLTETTNGILRKHSSSSNSYSINFSKSLCLPFNCCSCLTNNIKYRQHIQAFRSIVIITLLGILFCLYPIFMHELRPVISTNQHIFDLKQKVTHTYAVIWKRCYYSEKHEYAYDIIGIILSSLLHILPLTFVAVINLVIIVRLKQRQRLLTISTNTYQPTKSNTKKQSSHFSSLKKCVPYKIGTLSSTNSTNLKVTTFMPQSTTTTTHKDQSTLTDPAESKTKFSRPMSSNRSQIMTQRRHQARDRNITIMLVSVALSYIILTIPYRLFWSYNVYIKRMYPEKLNSSVYLLKMHYIDHILRTIRNIHYGTNFIFFIFLSKVFRRKFYHTFIGKFLYKSNRFFHSKNSRQSKKQQGHSAKLEDPNDNQPRITIINRNEHFGKSAKLQEHSKCLTNTNLVQINHTSSIIQNTPT